jgi:hypothetical protein
VIKPLPGLILSGANCMRRSSLLLGAISLTVFMVAGMAVIAIAAKNNSLDTESRLFVSTAIPAIFTEWNEKELVERASTELKTAVNDRELKRLFGGMARKFGRLQNWEQVDGGAFISMSSDREIVITGEYVARTRFDAGEANILLSLVKDSGNWRILSFRLDSEIF